MATYFLDTLGKACPYPLQMAQKKIADMTVGESVLIETDHAIAARSMLEWAEKNSHRFEVDETGGVWRITLIKG